MLAVDGANYVANYRANYVANYRANYGANYVANYGARSPPPLRQSSAFLVSLS